LKSEKKPLFRAKREIFFSKNLLKRLIFSQNVQQKAHFGPKTPLKKARFGAQKTLKMLILPTPKKKPKK